MGYYGDQHTWCWIQSNYSRTREADAGLILRVFCFYFWIWAAVALIIAIYIKVLKGLNAHTEIDEYDDHLRENLITRLIRYPLVLIA
jgi:hypothetical protein